MTTEIDGWTPIVRKVYFGPVKVEGDPKVILDSIELAWDKALARKATNIHVEKSILWGTCLEPDEERIDVLNEVY